MAGKRGKSGPIGNLNASRHPWRSFWRRRALRTQDKWILTVLETYASSLELDKPDLSAAERRMIEIAQISRGCSMLILAECARQGLIIKKDGSWDLAPGAKELSRFLGIERSSLQALGLGRRAKQLDPIQQLLDEPEGEHETASS